MALSDLVKMKGRLRKTQCGDCLNHSHSQYGLQLLCSSNLLYVIPTVGLVPSHIVLLKSFVRISFWVFHDRCVITFLPARTKLVGNIKKKCKTYRPYGRCSRTKSMAVTLVFVLFI